MQVLVIPDIHLKPWMFKRAAELMRQGTADQAVCLMDMPDDWNQEFNIGLYEETYDAAIQFAKDFPDTLWCYGNHDMSYLWYQLESGYSVYAQDTVQKKFREFKKTIRADRSAFIHRIDNVLFMHGGLSDAFVKRYVPARYYNDIDKVVETINGFDAAKMWQNSSPLWFRPQDAEERMYKPKKMLQIVGHTPVSSFIKCGNVISCDVFSTYRNGRPIGIQEFLVVDTATWDFYGVK